MYEIKDYPKSKFPFYAVVDELLREVFYALSRASDEAWIEDHEVKNG